MRDFAWTQGGDAHLQICLLSGESIPYRRMRSVPLITSVSPSTTRAFPVMTAPSREQHTMGRHVCEPEPVCRPTESSERPVYLHVAVEGSNSLHPCHAFGTRPSPPGYETSDQHCAHRPIQIGRSRPPRWEWLLHSRQPQRELQGRPSSACSRAQASAHPAARRAAGAKTRKHEGSLPSCLPCAERRQQRAWSLLGSPAFLLTRSLCEKRRSWPPT